MKKTEDHRRYALHIFALSSMVLAQPLLNIISQNPEILVAQKVSLADLLILITLVSAFIPTLLAIPGLLLKRLIPKAGISLSIATIGFLVALLLSMIIKSVFALPDLGLVVISALGGISFVRLYKKLKSLRMFCSYLSPVIAIVPALFLFSTDVFRIVVSPSTEFIDATTSAADIPVVMLVLDELPLISLLDEELQIDSVRYPNFSELAAGSHWFRSASTPSAVTTIAVPSILSGKVDTSALPIAADYPQNLFTMLAPSHKLNVTEIVTSLCPQRFCENADVSEPADVRLADFLSDLSVVYLYLAAPSGLRERLPVIDQSWSNFTNRGAAQNQPGKMLDLSDAVKTRRGKFVDFVESIDAEDETSLYFYHALLPHMPWEFMPSGKAYSLTGNNVPGMVSGEDTWGDNALLVGQGYQRHLLQLSFVDQLLGQLMEQLKSENLYDESLVVVVSDHGANFWPTAERRGFLNESQRLDVTGIALFMKLPHQQSGLHHDEPASTLDILPTLAGQLNVPLSRSVNGNDLFAEENSKHLDARPNLGTYSNNATLQNKLSLFGSGDIQSIYEFGPHPQLLNLSMTGQNTQLNESLVYELNQRIYLDEVDLNSSVIPSWLTGRITGDIMSTDSFDLLVAINGTSVASTTSIPTGDDHEFSVLIPESAFINGRNEIALYRIQRSGDDRSTLEELNNLQDNQFSYTGRSNRENREIADQLGNVITLTPGQLRGSVVISSVNESYLQLSGWAVNTELSIPADYLLLDIDGALSYRGVPQISRMGVVELFDSPDVERSGFTFDVANVLTRGDKPVSLDVIAVSADTASSVYSITYLNGLSLLETGPVSNAGTPAPQAEYRFSSGYDTISGPDREIITIRDGQLAGYLDTVSTTDGMVHLGGWSANAALNSIADYYLLQIDNQLFYLGISNSPRTDVASTLNTPALEYSGFSFLIAEPLLSEQFNSTVRLLAVSGTDAVEVSSSAPLSQLLVQ